ncbi:MAG: hypothetical protein RL204_669 [Bacteroidota bacterium]|jgi:hypothetical protein
MNNDASNKWKELISKMGQDKDAVDKLAKDNPEGFLKEYGIDLNKIDLSSLKGMIPELQKQMEGLKHLYSNPAFKDVNNYHQSIKNKTSLTPEEDTKLNTLAQRAFLKDIENKKKSCFIGNSECNQIISAHSIQENGELSKISDLINGKSQVYHFIEDITKKEKVISQIDTTKASAFYGFCHKHDQMFEPIDKNACVSNEQSLFLYSLRSFAHSYHNIKAFQENGLGTITETSSVASSLVQMLKGLTSSLNMDISSMENDMKVPVISEEQLATLKITRFERHKQLLIDDLNNHKFDNLHYLTYQIDHLAPIVCASWLVMHIECGNGFMIFRNDSDPYSGFPIIMSVLPTKERKTRIILARFKSDTGSEFIFNRLKIATKERALFELEISKLIIENIENFYLNPKFWDNLSVEEKAMVVNARNKERYMFPEKRTETQMINFFSEIYQIIN